MANGKVYAQALQLRNVAAAEAVALLSEPQPVSGQDRQRRAMAFTALVKAWEAACERMRIVNGTPLPGSRRPSPAKPSRQSRRQSGLVQPSHPAQSKQTGQP